MKSQYLLALAFRLLGTMLVFQTLVLIPMVGFSLAQPSPGGGSGWTHIGPQIAGLVLGSIGACLFLFRARRLAERVVPDDERIDVQGAAREDADSIAAFRLLLRVVGAIAVVWAIPELVGQGMGYVVVRRVMLQHVWTSLLPGLIKLSIGIYLMRGGARVALLAYGSGDASPDEAPC